MNRLPKWCCFAMVVAVVAPVFADVIVLKTGGRLEGRVTDAPGDPDSVVFEDSRAQIKIARDRIREIREESDAADYLKIGDQFFAQKRYNEARDAYKRSLEAEPEGAEVGKRLEALKQAENRAAAEAQRERLKDVDAMLDTVGASVDAGKYADARAVLEERLPRDELLPRQKERVVELTKKLYRAWALERMDKLDRGRAAEYFEKYLKLNPSDEEAYANLIDIYSKMPEKTSQVIEAHWVRLQLDPNDHMTRKKLAEKYVEQARLLQKNAAETLGDAKVLELYEKAAEQLGLLYKAGEFERSDVERELVSVLRELRDRYRKKGDLDKAIAMHRKLPEPYRQNEDELLKRMEYKRDFRNLDAANVKGWIQLIKRLQSQGLDAYAQQEFRQVQSLHPNDPAVVGMFKDYARASLAEAEEFLRTARYEKAMAQAMTVIGEYGKIFEDIKVAAEEVRNKATVQLEKERRQGREDAMKFKSQGDRYFAEGKYHMENLLDPDRRKNPQLMSDKQEAIRYLKLAVEYFDKALASPSGLDEASRSAVQNDRATAQRYLDTLTAKKAPPLPGPRNRLRR